MESKRKTTYNYKVEDSVARMNEILNSSDNDYKKQENGIPSRGQLTFKNGYYVNVTALFIDIVGSSELPKKCRKPTLAKIYRCFLSECVAIMNSYDICKEISINGDCVWGVFETLYKENFDEVINVAAKLYSIVEILNYKLKKKKYELIKVGIGIDYGQALMIKAGYDGSSLNDVVWMGDVVNSACHIANEAGREGNEVILISEDVYKKISKEIQEYFKYLYGEDEKNNYYEATLLDSQMNKWYKDNCK